MLNCHSDWEALSMMIADAVIRKQSPASDLISQTQAEADFGRIWLRRMIDQGKVQRFYPNGVQNGPNGKIQYSHHQLMCLWAETELNMQPKVLFK